VMVGYGRGHSLWCAECDAACGLLVITLRYGSVWRCSFGSSGVCCLSRSVPAGWGLNCGRQHVSAETAIGGSCVHTRPSGQPAPIGLNGTAGIWEPAGCTVTVPVPRYWRVDRSDDAFSAWL